MLRGGDTRTRLNEDVPRCHTPPSSSAGSPPQGTQPYDTGLRASSTRRPGARSRSPGRRLARTGAPVVAILAELLVSPLPPLVVETLHVQVHGHDYANLVSHLPSLHNRRFSSPLWERALGPSPVLPRTAGVVLAPPSNALGRRGRVQPLAVGEVVVG